MAVDNNGDNHQPAGRPDGGQYAPKAGQGTDDDLATPSEVALLDAAAMLTGRREQARRDADATTGDDAWYTGKGRYLGYEYADAIVDAARHADDIPEGTTPASTTCSSAPSGPSASPPARRTPSPCPTGGRTRTACSPCRLWSARRRSPRP